MEAITQKSVLVAVPLVAFSAPLILALVLQKLAIYRREFIGYFKHTLPSMYNEFFLFTSIGFFGRGLMKLDITSYVSVFLTQTGLNSPMILVIFIISAIALLAIIGIHPLISIATIAISFSAAAVPLTELQLALSMLAGYVLYLTLSPFSTLTLLFSGLTKENPLDISLRLNYPFALLFATMSVLLIMVV